MEHAKFKSTGCFYQTELSPYETALQQVTNHCCPKGKDRSPPTRFLIFPCVQETTLLRQWAGQARSSESTLLRQWAGRARSQVEEEGVVEVEVEAVVAAVAAGLPFPAWRTRSASTSALGREKVNRSTTTITEMPRPLSGVDQSETVLRIG